jgi:hypothetical protein
MNADSRGSTKHDPRGSCDGPEGAAISRKRLLIQPAGISGGKLPSVHPCPKILALQRAIFGTVRSIGSYFVLSRSRRQDLQRTEHCRTSSYHQNP